MPQENAFESKSISYNIGGQEFVVRPLPLKRLKEVLRIGAEGFREFSSLANKPSNDVLTSLPDLLISRFQELAPLILGPTATKDFIEANASLPQAIQILKDAIEMNQITDFFSLLNPAARAQVEQVKAPPSTTV